MLSLQNVKYINSITWMPENWFFFFSFRKHQNSLSKIRFMDVFSHQSFRLLLSKPFWREIFFFELIQVPYMTFGIIFWEICHVSLPEGGLASVNLGNLPVSHTIWCINWTTLSMHVLLQAFFSIPFSSYFINDALRNLC